MEKFKLMNVFYKTFFKPIAFSFDAELVHDTTTSFGEFLENYPNLVETLFSFKSKNLKREIAGIIFDNPIGLAAGFDYDGHLAKVMKHVGFGFNTIGTVTYLAYTGNAKPRLARLPRSKSLLVNKGFKSEGAIEIAKRLDKKDLKNHVIGISVGDREGKIENMIKVFEIFKKKSYVKYFELNISCPNIPDSDNFMNPKNFEKLVKAIAKLKLKKIVFVKMPNEISLPKSDKLVEIALKNKINGFIFSNLVKDRNNKYFDKSEIKKFRNFKGNFSGKPTSENSLKLIKHTRKKFGDRVIIIGTGGIFNARDALDKLNAGADLVQLITGMIYEGPQLIGEICKDLTNATELH